MKNNTIQNYIMEFMEIDKGINRYYQNVFKQWKLTVNSYLALYSLLNHPDGIEPAHLADELAVQRQLITQVINDFTKRGFIRKKENISDHRRKLIFLTKKGQRFAQDVFDHILEIDTIAMTSFTVQEINLMINFHRRFLQNLPAFLKKS